MSLQIPAAFTPFIEQLVAEGRYPSAEEAVSEAMQLFQDRETLRREVQRGVDEIERGEKISGDQVYRNLGDRIEKWKQRSGTPT